MGNFKVNVNPNPLVLISLFTSKCFQAIRKCIILRSRIKAWMYIVSSCSQTIYMRNVHDNDHDGGNGIWNTQINLSTVCPP